MQRRLCFKSAEQAATFSGERDGNTYSRFSNPTVSVFERRLAAMEGGGAYAQAWLQFLRSV